MSIILSSSTQQICLWVLRYHLMHGIEIRLVDIYYRHLEFDVGSFAGCFPALCETAGREIVPKTGVEVRGNPISVRAYVAKMTVMATRKQNERAQKRNIKTVEGHEELKAERELKQAAKRARYDSHFALSSSRR
jgi:hypothetical protein